MFLPASSSQFHSVYLDIASLQLISQINSLCDDILMYLIRSNVFKMRKAHICHFLWSVFAVCPNVSERNYLEATCQNHVGAKLSKFPELTFPKRIKSLIKRGILTELRQLGQHVAVHSCIFLETL